MTPDEAWKIFKDADLVVPEATIQSEITRLADEITTVLADRNPLVLAVMGGSVFFVGQLLPRLAFPLEFDYIHASRYGDDVSGGTVAWRVEPRDNVRGRVILILDDILDGGQTLAAIKVRLLQDGATAIYCAVLADKENGLVKPFAADFVGVSVPDRFVFGCGMDCRGAWRNLPAIYACAAGA